MLVPSRTAPPVAILAVAWLAGDGARTRRAYLAEVEQRARDAERDRDRQAGQRVRRLRDDSGWEAR